jgi:hypothetical protein
MSRLFALAYLVLMTLVVYGAMNRWDPASRGWSWMLPVLGLVQLAAGFFVGRWWALLLPLLVVVISVPAGYAPDPHGEAFIPIWFGLAILAVVAVPLVALGCWGRLVVDPSMRPRVRRPGPQGKR